ncbi:MAG: hypothetical protein QF437_05185 [Planctomycetota bacterium]|jgi:hypothetical protein|nr:hypothetical protein [Planctomycetota bacterium]MDP7129858.1 hypothetical protein [Planctomycetota bacterium]MDP7249681.1 hypothetical protein [Planctomycetota bacterium]
MNNRSDQNKTSDKAKKDHRASFTSEHWPAGVKEKIFGLFVKQQARRQ